MIILTWASVVVMSSSLFGEKFNAFSIG